MIRQLTWIPMQLTIYIEIRHAGDTDQLRARRDRIRPHREMQR